MRFILILLAIAGLGLTAGASMAAPKACGTGWNDWCRSPLPHDRCNRHKTAEACRADLKCYGMPYRGESFVPCWYDERGFASNCPTVGCTSRKPRR